MGLDKKNPIVLQKAQFNINNHAHQTTSLNPNYICNPYDYVKLKTNHLKILKQVQVQPKAYYTNRVSLVQGFGRLEQQS